MDELHSHHADSWGWALACCRWQRALAEDALQEAYLRVLDGRAHFGGQSSRKTWFFGVIKRVAAELQRRQARQGLLDFGYLFAANDAPAQDPSYDVVEEDAANRQLRRAMRSLSQRQREVIHLVFYAELTLEESARALGMTLGSARTHYHRGKRRLAELLELEHE